MTTRNGCRLVAWICGLTLSTMTAHSFAASNLLTNPGFDSSLAGWTVLYDRPASWSSLDAAGMAGSGSAVLVDTGPGYNGITGMLAQCVTVLPSTLYSFGGQMIVPSGQPAYTRAAVFLHTYAAGDCTGSELQFDAVDTPFNNLEWDAESSTFTTDPGAHSLQFYLGVGKAAGAGADASAHFDNVFVRQGAFAIGPSMSASWYNPAQSGHGITLELLDSTRAWMCWFTFDAAGNRAWICSQGSVGGVTITLANAFTVQGGNFPPLFDPQKIVHVPWGSITITFTGCDTATMTWSTTAPGFQSGSMPLSRLTSLWGNACTP